MNKFTVAIIKENQIQFTYNIDTLTLDELKTQIEPFIEFREVDINSMMELIVDTINLDPDAIGDTTPILENAEYVFQLCHLGMDLKNKSKLGNINHIASYVVLDQFKVYGNCVALKSKIKENGICEPANLTLDDIVWLMYKKTVHYGVLVKTNGTVEEFKFNQHPFEKQSENIMEQFGVIEVPFLRFNLIALYEKIPKDDVINKKATRIMGNKKVHGTIAFVSQSSENEYLDIDKELFNKLYTLAAGPLKLRKLTEDEEYDDKKIDELRVVINRYRILDGRLKTFTNQCNKCTKILTNDYKQCSGCYRLVYCSDECQADDWSTHQTECIYKIPQINKT